MSKNFSLFVLILQTYEVSSIRTQMNICTGDGKVLPSRQVSDDDSCRRINSNGYENSAFQAKTHLGIQKYSSLCDSLSIHDSLLP
jgi:hypothetical protein